MLAPVLPYETRWTGLYHTLRRLNQVREKLIQVSKKEGAHSSIDEPLEFWNRALKYEKMLNNITKADLELQIWKQVLSDCRLLMESLRESVQEKRDIPGSSLEDSTLGSVYISAESAVVKYKNFRNGFVKLQHGN